jgi:hypothetical protein
MLGRFCVKIARFLAQVLLGTWIIDQPAAGGLFFDMIDLLASLTQSAFYLCLDC